MAYIYPTNFTGRPSEKIPFEKIKKLKDENLIVYYGRDYLYRAISPEFNLLNNGEVADFLIIHPKKGIIFVESKKGIISYNKEEGSWYQNERLLKRDPIQQAMDHKKKALRKIQKETKIDINIPTIHAVLFYETPKPENLKKEFRFDVKPEMMMWREEFNNLDDSINKILALQETKYFINKQDLTRIHTLFSGQDISNPLKSILLANEQEQNLKLSESQEQILGAMFDFLNKKIAVRGLAGTGKTILLAKRAVDVINERKRVLILTKTKPLYKFLQLLTNISDNRLTISNVDYFVRSIFKKYNEPYSFAKDSTDTREHFDHYTPNMCLEIFNKYPKEKYDLILVDEAQDFYKDWYEALCFAKKDDGQIVFFYDPFQEQHENSMIKDLEKSEDVTKFALRTNFRNTSVITNLLSKLIKSYFPENQLTFSKPQEGHSKIPEFIEISDRNNQIYKIAEIVENLTYKEKISPKNIAIIYDGSIKAPSRKDPSITTELKKKGLSVVSAEEYSESYTENSLTLDTIKRFKGLEKTVIILTNLKIIDKDTVKDLYTGLSRARAHLIVVSQRDTINKLKGFI